MSQLSFTCQPGCSAFPHILGLRRGLKSLSHIPPPCRVGFPGSSSSPLLNVFWLHPIPSREDFPRVLPSAARRGREVALWPHGNGCRGRERSRGHPAVPAACRRGGGSPPPRLLYASPKPFSHPSCRGTAASEEPGETPPSLQNFALQKEAMGEAGGGGVAVGAARYDLSPGAVMDAGRVAAQWGHPTGPVGQRPRSVGSQGRGPRAPGTGGRGGGASGPRPGPGAATAAAAALFGFFFPSPICKLSL